MQHSSIAVPHFTLPRRCFVQRAQEAVTLSMLTALAVAHYVSKDYMIDNLFASTPPDSSPRQYLVCQEAFGIHYIFI